jgi:hypothetical protein
MNFKELHEGAEPSMPGAPSGIAIMTPQQFVAKAGDMPDKGDDEEVEEGKPGLWANIHAKRERIKHGSGEHMRTPGSKGAPTADALKKSATEGMAESSGTDASLALQKLKQMAEMRSQFTYYGLQEAGKADIVHNAIKSCSALINHFKISKQLGTAQIISDLQKEIIAFKNGDAFITLGQLLQGKLGKLNFQQGVAESQEHLDRIRKLSGLGEATKLPAQTRDLDSQEFQDYMKRIVGTPDLDKSGNVKIDKKGNEKYTTGKTKGDKYKMPYIHRSSVVTYLSPDGKTYDEDAVKQTLAIRPKSLLKQNEKMKHSNGEFEQFFNVGFAALVGIALDEQTNKLIIVNTCPGAGSCKVECFAMKGGKIQFKAAWQSDGRILTYLLNDPDGFFNQLSSEIAAEAQAAAKGDKKFPNGWQTTVRWHDAGDFFSPEYLDMALKMAAKHPDVKFYAYTKMAGAALADKPDNFIINWSEGANTTQEKQIKAQDPKLDNTKNSRIVPEKLFYDLLAKDEKGNLEKTADGAWQPAGPQELQQMKQRIATEYGISANSILSYTEYMAKRNSIPAGMKYNVIVAPGEGDVSANDPGVLSTLLLRH